MTVVRLWNQSFHWSRLTLLSARLTFNLVQGVRSAQATTSNYLADLLLQTETVLRTFLFDFLLFRDSAVTVKQWSCKIIYCDIIIIVHQVYVYHQGYIPERVPQTQPSVTPTLSGHLPSLVLCQQRKQSIDVSIQEFLLAWWSFIPYNLCRS